METREPRLATRQAMNVVGLEIRTSNAREADPATAKIPGLWQRVFAQKVPGRIPHGMNPGTLLAVYTRYESDHNGEYSLVVGSEVSVLDGIPQDMTAVTLAASEYLVFEARGPMPQAVIETWSRIWDYFASHPAHRRAYTADFELYEPRSQGPSPEVDIYIAIQ
ncbi:MAG TPA: GyrI-like domain-containing protein [Terriglobia bacterium]|nr:GyrI-like domain-containing protein [Terriglobia bacterium]